MKEKIKLGFSGGGFRATFYCLGGYRRLIEFGFHRQVSAISSVSGGSIAAGAIMFEYFKCVEDFDNRVTKPLRKIGQINLRRKIMKQAYAFNKENFKLLFNPKTRFSNSFPVLLDELLFKDKLMIELPSEPEWSCNGLNSNYS
ncbi:hypothetical protein U9K47_15865 [Bacillus toyonensis]|uniref:hypothetical protein n=1 Tax=Bacillus toyonensis TaxID=155322 RepID=UPI00346504B3